MTSGQTQWAVGYPHTQRLATKLIIEAAVNWILWPPTVWITLNGIRLCHRVWCISTAWLAPWVAAGEQSQS